MLLTDNGQRSKSVPFQSRDGSVVAQCGVPSVKPQQPKLPVEPIDEWAVVVRDEALICPCVEIAWELEPPESGLQQLEVRPNPIQPCCLGVDIVEGVFFFLLKPVFPRTSFLAGIGEYCTQI